MYFAENSTTQIDDLLNRIGEKLQLNKTRKERVEQSYNAVSSWLDADDTLFEGANFDIYPQGSYSLGTTVKPMKGEEFDLDFVLQIHRPWDPSIGAMDILDKVERRMKEHDTYKDLVERKNRCIRINYTNEFHMDILPGMPFGHTHHYKLKVPDCKTEFWKDSAPKGYISWFNSRLVQKALLEKAAKIEQLPEELPYEMKHPLQRSVQLIKRYRNVAFQDNLDMAPISIVLTTLAGTYYNGLQSEYEAIKNILLNINYAVKNANGTLDVYNPSNVNEKLSERWDEDKTLYKAFKDFAREFYISWEELSFDRGLVSITQTLQKMFGETVTNEAITEQAEFIEKSRKSNKLYVIGTSGSITSNPIGAIEVPKNTFYGSEKK